MENKGIFLDLVEQNGVVYARLNPNMAGYNMEREIMPEVLKYIKENDHINEFVFKDADGVEVRIDKTANLQESIDDLNENREAEGLEAIDEEEKDIDFGESFTSFDEIKNAFIQNENKHVDLSNCEASKKDSMSMCETILSIIMRSTEVDFDEQQVKTFSDCLKYAGYVDYADTHEKYREADMQDGVEKEEITLEEASQTRDSLYLPLTIIKGFVDVDKNTFMSNMQKLRVGGEHRKHVVCWCKTQELNREKNMIVEEEFIYRRTYRPAGQNN